MGVRTIVVVKEFADGLPLDRHVARRGKEDSVQAEGIWG